VNKWLKENPGLVVCFGFPLAIAVAFLHPVIAGAMLLFFLWAVFSNANLGPGGDDGPWDGFGRP
jgi:hypothetical protein